MSSTPSTSLWESPLSSDESLELNLSELAPETRACDVCVVGAGIAGLSVAMCLLEAGLRVLVIDRREIGGGETLRTSAHLASALDDRFRNLERWFGEEGARLAAESHAAAIDRIEFWCNTFGVDCDFRRVDGYLFAAPENAVEFLVEEMKAAARAGLSAEFCPRGLDGLETLGPAIRFAAQARFDPRRYLRGLARAFAAQGGMFAQATAVGVEGGTRPTIELEDGSSLTANSVVIAANVPFHERVVLHTKQAPYRTFCIAAPVPKGSVPDALLWDDADPYHYVRIVPGEHEDTLILGGEDHKTGQPEPGARPYALLYEWGQLHFRQMGPVAHAWSGQVLEPVDGLGFIGRDPGGKVNVYVVTGDSGHGLTHGTLAGPLLRALILGEEHPWQSLYDPGRVHFGGAAAWCSENLNVALQYADWLAAGGASSVAEIGRGQGKILRHGLHRLAVFRDEVGCLYAHSAACPHLGASVRWNARERSWDCPAHGSRFDPYDGRALNGPSSAGLEKATLPT